MTGRCFSRSNELASGWRGGDFALRGKVFRDGLFDDWQGIGQNLGIVERAAQKGADAFAELVSSPDDLGHDVGIGGMDVDKLSR